MAITSPFTAFANGKKEIHLGQHVLAEFFDCDPNTLNSLDKVEKYMDRFTHIALFNGMQLESNSIIGCGICRDVHPHLRGRKAAIQNSGSNTTKSYTYFIHTLPFLNYLLASLCLIFSTQYGVSLEMKFHARTNAFSGLRYGSGISTWWDSP